MGDKSPVRPVQYSAYFTVKSRFWLLCILLVGGDACLFYQSTYILSLHSRFIHVCDGNFTVLHINTVKF